MCKHRHLQAATAWQLSRMHQAGTSGVTHSLVSLESLGKWIEARVKSPISLLVIDGATLHAITYPLAHGTD